MSDNEFLCVRCARHRRTCCQISEVYATPGDVSRIAAHTGRTEFVEFRVPENPDYVGQPDDPDWSARVFRSDNTRRVLKRMPEGDCTFLGPHGCTLPLDVRPLICRLYPYDYTADGLRTELTPGCPLELLPIGQSLLQALDMHESAAVAWHRQLYQEIRLEPPVEPAVAPPPLTEPPVPVSVQPCTSV